MKNRDARFYLNNKKKLFTAVRTDARNIIKSRKNNQRQKFFSATGRNPTRNSDQFINFRNRNLFTNRQSSSKKIILQKSGDIRITSSRSQEPPQQTPVKNVQASSSGIQVTTLNVQKRHLIDDDDDDVEKMTWNDIPEIKNTKSPVRAPGLPPVKHWEPSISANIGSRLQGHYNSMVADSYSSQQGYTVVVTNLLPSVSHEDIVELFGNIGIVSSAKLIQPGTAVIIYTSKKDALQACEIYHNRLLDGQPMQCVLVSTPSVTKPALSSRLEGRLSSSNLMNSSSEVAANRQVKYTVRVP